MIVYFAGAVRHTGVIPIGGEHFTNHIAVGLRTPIPEAEKMKRLWGERDEIQSADPVIEVKSVGERPSRVATYSMLNEIIEPRACELLDMLHAELGRAGCLKQMGSGLVLTGGGARLGGLVSLAEQALGTPVRIGIPQGLGKMGEVLPDPAFSAVAGLVIHGNRLQLMREPGDKGFMGKILEALRGKN